MIHPNVVNVRDACRDGDLDILVMEYVPGVSLDDAVKDGPLPQRDVVKLGIQLADGLAAAHAQRLIHRDLKPGNLRITADARLKILDFGLAKRLADSTSTTQSGPSTAPHTVVGTLPYMAPEQILGKALDQRVDVYAAGAVLYVMATGRYLFAGASSEQLVSLIANAEPERPRAINPGLSRELERVILKALAKKRDDRYPSARALQQSLEAIGGRASPWLKVAIWAGVLAIAAAAVLGGPALWRRFQPAPLRVAVLPFESMSSDPEQEYWADGMTEDLTTHLGELLSRLEAPSSRLAVIGSSSARRFKKTKLNAKQIGQQLHAAYLLSGSVQRADSLVRVRARLELASDNTQLWGHDFEGSPRDALAMQSQIADSIVNTVLPSLLRRGGGVPAGRALKNGEAYDAYLRGRSLLWRRGSDPAVLTRALESFQEAAAADPDFAEAHVGIAQAYLLLPDWGIQPSGPAMREAQAAVERALRLDPSQAGAHAAQGAILEDYRWDWAGAEREFKQAIALNASDPTAHQWYADLLSIVGRPQDALREIRHAATLDPLSSVIGADLGTTYLNQRRFDEAIAQFQITLEREPEYLSAYSLLAIALWSHGKAGAAAVALDSLVRKSAGESAAASLRDRVRADGPVGAWRWLLDDYTARQGESYASPISLAMLSALTGERDEAFRWLEQAYLHRVSGLGSVRLNPAYDALRSDPRYAEILARIGLKP